MARRSIAETLTELPYLRMKRAAGLAADLTAGIAGAGKHYAALTLTEEIRLSL